MCSSDLRLRFPVDVSGALTRSVVFALLAAAIAVPIAVGAARAIVRSRSRVASIASTLPLGPSAVVVGFGVLVAYDTGFLDIRGRWWLVPVVHACVALPFAVRAVVPLVEAIPSDLGGAAATLGASPLRRWFDIDRPLLRPALATATAFSLAVSLGEFGATSFLTRRGTTTVPIVVDALLGRAGAVPHATAFALSTVLLLATTAIVTVVDRGVRT